MSEADMTAESVSITIDGREVQARAGELLIAEAERNGVYIPRFCWHPRLRSVAMCRMCLVEIEGMRGLQPACYVPVKEGMEVRTQTDAVRKVQEGVLEYLLINHPLDCPVCDRGGECPLQDHTLAFGPGESRFVEDKRHFEKPIEVSELVLLDRERCIQCARCTRVAAEVAGDALIDFGSRGNNLHIITFPDEPFASYFSGNTVQVCPVGALTAAPYRFRARPWDVTAVETTCLACSVGCRGALYETRNEAIRLLGVDVDCVNLGWLCDKGRFGYEFTAAEDRLECPRMDGEDITWGEAIEATAIAVESAASVAAIGGARLTNEGAYALSKFMRVVAGSNDVDCQLDDGLPARFVAAVQDRATFEDIDTAAAVVLAAPDLKEELPVLYLRVRRAVLDHGTALYVAGGAQTGLDRFAARIAGRLEDLDAADLPADGDIVVVVGRQSLTQDPEHLVAWASVLAERLGGRVKLLPVLRRANAHGAIDMGLAPDLRPGRVGTEDPTARDVLAATWRGEFPTEPGRGTREILEAAAAGEIDVLFLVGADPVADFPDPDLAREALDRTPNVIVSDLFETPTTAFADVLVPAAGWGEINGTVTNVEGRVQRLAAAVVPPGQAASDSNFFREVAERLGVDFGCGTPAATLAEIRRVVPAYAETQPSALRGTEGKKGVMVGPGPLAVEAAGVLPAPSETRDGALAVRAARTLYDMGTLVSRCPSLAQLAPGPVVRVNPADAQRLGLQDGTEAVLRPAGDGEAATWAEPLRRRVVVDAGTHEGTVFVPLNQGDVPVAWPPGLEVDVEGAG
ncbi:MAG: NADH-quinone oxidoreductase subunit NuoG [Acidimicrobiia bacterium]|nr:NADH-quinone oxidoreductase subunit NuoG [Acidimicrobiia bacterium]